MQVAACTCMGCNALPTAQLLVTWGAAVWWRPQAGGLHPTTVTRSAAMQCYACMPEPACRSSAPALWMTPPHLGGPLHEVLQGDGRQRLRQLRQALCHAGRHLLRLVILPQLHEGDPHGSCWQCRHRRRGLLLQHRRRCCQLPANGDVGAMGQLPRAPAPGCSAACRRPCSLRPSLTTHHAFRKQPYPTHHGCTLGVD